MQRSARRAAVPEAAVDEDGGFFADVGDVRAAGDAFVVEAIAAKAGVPEGFAEGDLGFCVAVAVGAHHTRDGLAFGDG